MSFLLKKLIYKEKNIETLEDIYNQMHNTKHPLQDTANNLVKGEGFLYPDLMIIGEAPGKEEDIIGRPFVGMSGKMINDALFCSNLQREKVYITNILPWRPPLNRPPTDLEAQFFLQYLLKCINIVSPKMILALGLTSARALFNIEKYIPMSQILNKTYSINNIPAICCYHPSYLKRIPEFKKYLWTALRTIIKYIAMP